MRDATKVVIGFGSIWGLFAMGALLFTSFSLGADDSLPEVIDLVLYGATILPACVGAIWWRRVAAIWLITLGCLTTGCLAWQGVFLLRKGVANAGWSASSFATDVFLAAIPFALGYFLFRDRTA